MSFKKFSFLNLSNEKKNFNFKVLTLIFLIFLFLSSNLISLSQNFHQMNMLIGYIPHVQFAPLYVGIEKKIFEKYGLKLNIDYGFGRDIFGLLMSEKADFALTDADELIISAEKKMGLKAFYQYYQDFPISIVKLGNDNDPKSLIGKKIGLPDFYGTNYIGTLLFLNKYQLLNKVEIVKIGYTQIQSLVSKKVDAVACYINNEPIQLRNNGYNITEWKIKDFSDLVGGAFVSSEDHLKKNSEYFINFIKALNESILYSYNNKNETLDIAYKVVGTLNPDQRKFWADVLDATFQLILGKNNNIGVLPVEKYLNTIEVLYNLNFIKSKIKTLDILHFYQ
ncbi:MAG: ABC transporter substrate-binding protein [Spirochaetota bacterium]